MSNWGYEKGNLAVTEAGSGAYLGPNWRKKFIEGLTRGPQYARKYADIIKGYDVVESPFYGTHEYKEFLSNSNFAWDWDRKKLFDEYQKAQNAWMLNGNGSGMMGGIGNNAKIQLSERPQRQGVWGSGFSDGGYGMLSAENEAMRDAIRKQLEQKLLG